MNQDDIMRIAREAFDKEFPEYAAELAMYDAGSPAVSALDTIVARRALSVWKLAYAAGATAEREACAKVCDAEVWRETQNQNTAEVDGVRLGARFCAAAIRARGQSNV
jgi:hypothetical protein